MKTFKTILASPKHRRILKFLISGGSAALIEFVSFTLLLFLLGVPLLILVNAISFLLGLLTSFILNKLWVFQSRQSTAPEFAKYFTLAIVNLLLSSGLIFLLTSIGTLPLIAKIIVMILIAVWNYSLFSKYIFKQKAA